MAQSNATDPRADKLALAEAAISALKDDYSQQLAADADELATVWRSIDREKPDPASMDRLFAISHDLKGQAGSFGYDLVTSIAASLCDLVREDRVNPAKMPSVDKHVAVLVRVVEKGVAGTGGETGAKIVQGLRRLVAAD
ncbi:MAG: Hpt domain-containing protein [Parvibaculaceae bacterium]